MNKGIASGSFELMLTDSMQVALDHALRMPANVWSRRRDGAV